MSFRQRSNIRTKSRFAADDDEADDDVLAIKRLTESAKGKGKAANKDKAGPASKLSFGDDDAEVVYKVKKSSKLRGLSVPALATAPEEGLTPLGTSYSKNDLDELRKASQAKAPEAAVIKISGSFRAPESGATRASAMPDSFRLQPAAATRLGTAPAMPLPPPPRPAAAAAKPREQRWDRDTAASAASSGAPQTRALQPPTTTARTPSDAVAAAAAGDDDDDGDAFPDARMVQLAKQKRERLRHAQMAPDYVPSESGAFRAAAEYKKQEEAVRKGSDDDGSDDDPEDDMRLKFSGAASARAERKAPATLHDMHAASESDDDDGFADAQQRRAMASGGAGPLQSRVSEAIHRNAAGGGGGAAAPEIGALSIGRAGAPGGEAASISQAGAAALKGVEQHVARLRQRSARLRSDLGRTRGQVADTLASISQQEAAFEALGERYTFLQGMRAFMRDLCACLQHKAADVDALEDERAVLMAERCEATRRARADMRRELMGPAAAALQALDSFGPGVPAEKAAELAELAACRAEEAALERQCARKLDEFGRDENAYAREQATARHKERTAAFAALRARAAAEGGAPLDDDVLLEAASCGHDAAHDAAYYQRKVLEIAEIAGGVFRDVHDDFATLPAVTARLAAFRARYPAAYQQAYISDSLPALLSVFVRAELVTYDPVHANGHAVRGEAPAGATSFLEHKWFAALCDFGGEGGPDEDLVPLMVAKVLLEGKIRPLLRAAWEPTDVAQSAAVKDVVTDLLAFSSDRTAADFARLVDLVKQQLVLAIEEFEPVPSWPSARVATSPRVAAAAVLAWRDAVAFLRAVLSFRGLFSAQLLQELALQRLLARCITPALQVLAAEAASGEGFAVRLAVLRSHAVVTALPAEWLQAKLPELAQVGMAAQLVTSLGKRIAGDSLSALLADLTRAIGA